MPVHVYIVMVGKAYERVTVNVNTESEKRR